MGSKERTVRLRGRITVALHYVEAAPINVLQPNLNGIEPKATTVDPRLGEVGPTRPKTERRRMVIQGYDHGTQSTRGDPNVRECASIRTGWSA
jgi:hypothetical protein